MGETRVWNDSYLSGLGDSRMAVLPLSEGKYGEVGVGCCYGDILEEAKERVTSVLDTLDLKC